MGKNTRTYILGGIVGISVLFTLTMVLQEATTQVTLSTATAPQNSGHATILLTFEDESTIYMQTDNLMHKACLSSMHAAAFGNPEATAATFQTLQFYEGTDDTGSNQASPTLELLKKELADGADITSSTSTGGTGTLAGFTTLFTFDTVTFGQNPGTNADFGKFLRQIALTDGGAPESTCASFVIDTCAGTACGISAATTAVVTWTISTTDT